MTDYTELKRLAERASLATPWYYLGDLLTETIDDSGDAAYIAAAPAPSDTAREYMTGYSDGREWAQQTTAAGAVPCGKTDYQSLLREALVHFYHDGVPTDSEHPKRITVNKIEKALK